MTAVPAGGDGAEAADVSSTSAAVTTGTSSSLVHLLGEQRAAVVELLHRAGASSAAEVAAHLHVSEVAARRHLAVLVEEGVVATAEPRATGGRPATCYALSERGLRLFPQAYDRFANEVLDFLTDTQGDEGLRAFLRWRVDREARALREAVTAEDLHGRLQQLADALSDAGFEASVDREGDAYRLVQEHCAIADVAREHPEVCAYEAAAFARAIGGEARVQRLATIASGAPACECRVAAH